MNVVKGSLRKQALVWNYRHGRLSNFRRVSCAWASLIMIWSTEGPMLICAAVSTEKQRLSCHIWYELYQPLIHIPYTTVSSEETWVDLTQQPKSTPPWKKSCNTMLCSLVKVHCGVSIVECGVHTVECLAVWVRRALALSHCHHSIARAAAEWCTATTATAATYHCHH